MKRYRLRKTGSLLITKAALTGPQGTKIPNLLIDTGSTYTIVPTEALEATGCSPAESKEHIRIITGSGTILAPLVKYQSLNVWAGRSPVSRFSRTPCRPNRP